jgi:hypothetical protein
MSNRRAWWYAGCALALVVVAIGLSWAVAGAVSVTHQAPPGAPYTKDLIAFTLNGTTPVTATVSSAAPIKGGSIDARLTTSPTGTVTLTAYDSDVFTGTGQKDLVSEDFASQVIRVGLFDVVNTDATGYMLAPINITVSVVSTSTADTAINGTALVSLVN